MASQAAGDDRRHDGSAMSNEVYIGEGPLLDPVPLLWILVRSDKSLGK